MKPLLNLQSLDITNGDALHPVRINFFQKSEFQIKLIADITTLFLEVTTNKNQSMRFLD